jgi:antirestriction protein ArdC
MNKQEQLKQTLKGQQKELAEFVISNLEKGLSWRKCWTEIGGANGLPYSASTGNGYQGGNIWWLLFVAKAFGYDSTQWGTFRAWKTMGGCVRKGQKSTKIICYKPRFVQDAEGETVFAGGYFRQYSVFNRCQVDGLADEVTPEGTGIECRDGILFDYTEAEGIKVRTGSSAYYVPKRDSITLPSNFTDEARGWSTVAHEIIHSTGHGSRG